MLIDLAMTIVLILLMAYQITGDALHEWLGAGMLLLFLAHNALNIRWYRGLFKGKYTPVRIVRTVVNLALLVSILCLGYSGIVMSRHVFAFLPISSGMALARVMHLACSYWGFVLMSVHLGLHWGMILGMFRKIGGRFPKSAVWIARVCAILIAGYGAFCFWRADILSYMFLRVEFAFLDYEKSAPAVFAEYLAMMGFWIFVSYYAVRPGRKGAR